MEPVESAPKTVRELIVELSSVEDGLRMARRPLADRDAEASDDLDVAALVHREQVIVHELRRRARTRGHRRHLAGV